MRVALEEVGLTHAQFVVLAGLAWLSDDREPLTQARLSRHARTEAMMTSQILRALTTRGYVERAASPSDCRAKNLSLTREGQEIAKRSVRLVERADREFFATLGNETERMSAYLRRLSQDDQKPSRS